MNLVDRVSSSLTKVAGGFRAVEKQIDDSQRKLDEFGRTTATAKIDVNDAPAMAGIARATAALRAVDGMTATMRINTVVTGDRMTNTQAASPFQRSTYDRMFGGGGSGGAAPPAPGGASGGGNGSFFYRLGRGSRDEGDPNIKMPFGLTAGPVVGRAGPVLGLVAGAAAALAPVVPLLGAVTVGAGVALPGILALGAGFATIGAVAIPALSKVAEKYKAIEDARKKVKDSTGFDERNRAIAELRLAEARLSGPERKLIENFKTLKKAWEEATKPIKEDVFTIANTLVDTAKPLIDTFAPFMRQFSQVFVRASQGIQSFFGDPEKQKLLTEAFRPLPRILESVLGSLGSIAQIILGITAAAGPTAERFFSAIERYLGGRAEYATSARGLDSMRETFREMEPILVRLGQSLGNLWDNIMEIGRAAAPFVVPFLDAFDAIVDALGAFIVDITKKMGGDIQKIMRNFAQIVQKIMPGLATGFSIVVKAVSALLTMINKLPAGALKVGGMAVAVGLIATKLPGLKQVTGLVLQLARVGAGKGLQIIGQLIGGKAGGALQSLGGGLLERGTIQNPMFVKIVGAGGTGDVVATGGGGGKSRAGKILSGAGKVLGGALIGVPVGMAVNDGLDALTGNDKVGDVLGGAAAGAIIGGTIGSVVPVIGTGLGAAGGAVIGGVAGLFGFANGGIVNRPTVARIGERGPEAIIPLDNGIRAGQIAREAGLGGSRVGSLVTISGPVTIANGQDMDQFTKQLAREVRLAAATLVGG
jgi:hypothetical protein